MSRRVGCIIFLIICVVSVSGQTVNFDWSNTTGSQAINAYVGDVVTVNVQNITGNNGSGQLILNPDRPWNFDPQDWNYLKIDNQEYYAISSASIYVGLNKGRIGTGFSVEIHLITNYASTVTLTINLWNPSRQYILTINVSDPPSPAGKTLWLKANTGVTLSGTGVSSWDDQSFNGLSFNSSGSYQPTFFDNYFNFNPSISFDGSDDQLSSSIQNPRNLIKTTENTIVFAEYISSGKVVFDFDGRTAGLFRHELYNSHAYFTFPTSNYYNGAMTEGSTAINGSLRIVSFRSNSSVHEIFVNGLADGSTNCQLQYPMDRNNVAISLGSDVNSANYVNASLPELILFANRLSDNSRLQAESYLALKYGVTLGSTATPVNYYDGAGNTVWNATSTYQNYIAGIASDATWGLYQRVSSSVNLPSTSSSGIVIATTNNFTLGNSDASRVSLSSGQYLIWGSNTGSTASWNTSGNYDHVNRFWRVQNTGGTGNIYFQINLSGYPSLPSGKAYTLLIDDNGNLSDGGTTEISLSNTSGTLYSASSSFSFPSGVAYFTIGYNSQPGITAELSGDTTICRGGTANLYVTISNGTGPYTVVISNGTTNDTVSNYTSGTAIPYSPVQSTIYSLVSVEDQGGNPASVSGTATVTVNWIDVTVDLVSSDYKCPDFITPPFNADNYNYNAGATEAIFRVTRQNPSGYWGFTYSVDVVNSDINSFSPNPGSGTKDPVTADYIDIDFYVTNSPGNPVEVTLTVSDVWDTNCSFSGVDEADTLHIDKMPVLGPFN